MTNFHEGSETEETFKKHFLEKSDIDENEYMRDISFPITTSLRAIEHSLELSLDEEDLSMQTRPFMNEYPINLNNSSQESCSKDKLFDIILPKSTPIFSKLENDSSTDDGIFLERKRYSIKRRRRENKDNIRKKIKRGFLNNALINKINTIIKSNRGKLCFKRFQQHFVSDVAKKSNKVLLNMTLKEIFEKKEIYDTKELKFYYHNLKLIQSEEILENEELKNILNKKYCELYDEYLNSKEFMHDEIKRLKNNKMEDSYIKRYIYLARNFINFINE
jgi:hypothetical protein